MCRLTIVIVTGSIGSRSVTILCKAFWFTLFCLTGFPVVFGDKTGDDITKAHIGNTSWLYVGGSCP